MYVAPFEFLHPAVFVRLTGFELLSGTMVDDINPALPIIIRKKP